MPEPAAAPLREYQLRQVHFAAICREEETSLRRMANLRLAVFAAGVAAAYLAWTAYPLLAIGFAGAVLIFAWLVRRHEVMARRHAIHQALRDINAEGIARLTDDWHGFVDDGRDFADDAHAYTSDLDIFGQGSLFQWLNTTATPWGRAALARLFAAPDFETGQVLMRQEAVGELAAQLVWRQQLHAEGRTARRRGETDEDLLAWMAESDDRFSPLKRAVYRILPALTLLVAVLWWQAGAPFGFLALLLLGQAVLFVAGYRRNSRELGRLRGHADRIAAYRRIFAVIEGGADGEPAFKSALLAGARASMRESAPGLTASQATARLSRTADWLEIHRSAVLHTILNVLFLWDYHFIIALENWRRNYGSHMRGWLAEVGEVEALASLAGLAFDQPGWCLPTLQSTGPLLDVKDLGHPLLPPDRRVANSVRIDDMGRVLLITGSNMSGKSTFLRTVGINFVLAFAGAPACASSFACRHVNVHTSMRTADNLEKSISSFYAELLRVKGIVEAARAGEPVLFLIDEIFRGTNSEDRQTGARMVLQRLSAMGSAGLVSTHDLELGKLAEAEGDRFSVYHFAEYYEAGDLRFEYRLRPGIATTRNAMHLMRLVGIVDA